MTAADRRFGVKVAAAIVAVLAAGWLGLWLMGWDDAVPGQELDCATRPYADLPADQLPCMFDTGSFDGHGHAHLSGVNPGPETFTAGSFHVPDPDQWLEAQSETMILPVPPGPFDVVLPCEPGAAQVDMWLAGHEEAYVAATTLDCGTEPEIAAPVPVEAPTATSTATSATSVPTDVRGDDTATTATGLSPVPAGGAVSGEQEQDNPTPPGSSAPASASTRPLPNTGAFDGLLLVGAVVLILVGSGVVHIGRKAGRS